MFIYRPQLIDTFFRTGLFIFQNIFHTLASVWVSSFLMSLILVNHIVAVMLRIISQFNLAKRKIILFSPVFHCGISLIAVPVNILADSFIVDMLTVFRVKSSIIVERIINAIFSRSSIMPCAFQFTFPLSFKFFPEGNCSEAAKSLCLRYRQYPVLSGETPLNWAMAAALNLLRASPLNPSKVLPPFAIQAQRTSSPLYSRQTKHISCRCPFGKIFCSICFSKILCIGFCENKKADVVLTFAKVQIHRLNPFDLIGHYSIFLTGSYSPFL